MEKDGFGRCSMMLALGYDSFVMMVYGCIQLFTRETVTWEIMKICNLLFLHIEIHKKCFANYQLMSKGVI